MIVSAEISPGVWLDGRRALWLAGPRLLVVADLHWGYAMSHQASGNLLPTWGDDELATRLRALIADYQPAETIWLGDSLHTLAGREAAEQFLRDSPAPTTVLSGNHDKRWTIRTTEGNPPQALPGSLSRGEFFFHHGHFSPAPVLPEGCLEIIGHHHPALGWSDGAGGRLKLPALVAAPRRLILPAFSPWAAGAPWNAHLADDETLFAIAPKRIFAVSRALLHKSRFSA